MFGASLCKHTSTGQFHGCWQTQLASLPGLRECYQVFLLNRLCLWTCVLPRLPRGDAIMNTKLSSSTECAQQK